VGDYQGEGQCGESPVDGQRRSGGADEEWSTGVAEFPADLGGAHGLAESLWWCADIDPYAGRDLKHVPAPEVLGIARPNWQFHLDPEP
jgi:hypothetical protein